ncbi:MAG: 8-oxoguanine glycosylase domain protein [Verrucomicrobiales bacterium]|nr:8-oxoguanine glycosylase domain protein [Verrucomicrobiales bacterium]
MNLHQTSVPIEDYDLDATLSSGQAFRWKHIDGWWEGVIGQHWVRLRTEGKNLLAETAAPVADWTWLHHYLQLDVNLSAIVETFPNDEPMQASLDSCRGLRLLRQDPWECLASFICSSTKQIIQIQQIMAALCKTFGDSLPVPIGHAPAYSFPTAQRIANLTEADLRGCKMGFRAPYVLGTARAVVSGEVSLEALHQMKLVQAREQLLKFPGVGVKIADCVLLFAYGFDQAFPIDVWIMKAVQQLYFPKRRASLKRLRKFTETHFGPHAGYAQQYLFHYMRVKNRTTK